MLATYCLCPRGDLNTRSLRFGRYVPVLDCPNLSVLADLLILLDTHSYLIVCIGSVDER
jgi:hypothetical protein